MQELSLGFKAVHDFSEVINMGALKGNKNAFKHGQSRSLAYRSWETMKARCTNPHNNKYFRYGKRGITVDEKWLYSFQNFLSDMGERLPGTTLDRIDNDGNYELGNCRWATFFEQAKNRQYIKKTHCIHGHVFDKKNTYIRPDKGTKQCKKCSKLWQNNLS